MKRKSKIDKRINRKANSYILIFTVCMKIIIGDVQSPKEKQYLNRSLEGDSFMRMKFPSGNKKR